MRGLATKALSLPAHPANFPACPPGGSKDGTSPFTLGAEDDIPLTEGAGRWMLKSPLPKQRKEDADAGRWKRGIHESRE